MSSVLSLFCALLFTFAEYTGTIKLLDANSFSCVDGHKEHAHVLSLECRSNHK